MCNAVADDIQEDYWIPSAKYINISTTYMLRNDGVLIEWNGVSMSDNIRELENIIEYAFILCHEQVIRVAHLPEHFRAKYEDKGLSELAGQTLAAIQKRGIDPQ